ncbi:hypothetical protein [Deinococcus apachensis]|uniref:hypothetical protein n=1 Tax=Deinococcus apachensis TaxID=309886 RepID=UPI0003A93A7F|nr:hypothetical protein [Deinococcus apachensis]
MPLSALRHVVVNQILRTHEIGPRLVGLLQQMTVEGGRSNMNEEQRRRLTAEVQIGAGNNTFHNGVLSQGPPSTGCGCAVRQRGPHLHG